MGQYGHQATTDTPIVAAIYTRISLDKGYGEMAVERQEKECRERAARDGIEITHVYSDVSISAYQKKKRPSYDALVQDVRDGKINRVYVWDLDRLTRQPGQLNEWIDLADHGKCYVVEAHGMALDLTKTGHILIARIRVDVAENESRHKGERQIAAARQRAEKGIMQPHGKRCIGYTRDGHVFEPEATAVREVYKAFLAGASIERIRAALSGRPDSTTMNIPHLPVPNRTLALEYNERHKNDPNFVPRVPTEETEWDRCSVTHILRNPKYAGFSMYGDRRAPFRKRRQEEGRDPWELRVRDPETGGWVRMRDWTPLVSEEDWERVQVMLNDPTRKTTTHNHRTHLGSSLYRCSVCGDVVHLNGRCYSCRHKGHVMRAVKSVDAYVERVIAEVLSTPDIVQSVHVRRQADTRAQKAVRDNIAECERRIASVQDKLKDPQCAHESFDMYLSVLEGLTQQVAELKASLEEQQLEQRNLPPLIEEPSPAEAFATATLDVKRRVIDVLCDVYLTPSNGGGRRYNVEEAVQFRWKTAATPPAE